MQLKPICKLKIRRITEIAKLCKLIICQHCFGKCYYNYVDIPWPFLNMLNTCKLPRERHIVQGRTGKIAYRHSKYCHAFLKNYCFVATQFCGKS